MRGAGKALENLLAARTCGDHDQRRVLHRSLLQQFARVAAHGNALSAALRVPEHARLSRAGLHLVAVGGSAFVDGVVRILGLPYRLMPCLVSVPECA